MTRPIDIGLLWHSASSGNLGVGALTVANMAIVREVAAECGLQPRFTIIGARDGVATYLDPSDADVFVVDMKAMLDPRRCWQTINRQDCILDIGGGDSFADIYASKRYAYIWGTKAMAILGRTPLMLCPQTIGPFTREPHTALAAYAVRHAAVVMARDKASLAATEALAPRTRRVLTTDVAFALPYTDRSVERDSQRPKVGMNVSGLLFTEVERGRNRFGLEVDYAELTRELIARLQSSGAEVHLLTHATTNDPLDDDGRACDRLAAEFPDAVRVADFKSPSEAKSYISGLDFLVAARMHACIAAVSSGTPVAPIAYSRKFRGVFGDIGYTTLVDTTGKTTSQAADYVMDRFACRDEVAAEGREAMQKVGALHEAYRAELRTFLTRAAP
jgi:colanic acid/amylovoran biosynthesis protein